MKFLAVFAAIVSVALSYEAVSIWSINQLAAALQDPATDPAIIPYLEKALNQLMNGLFHGDTQTSITISLPVQTTMTLDELTQVVHDPNTNPALVPYYESALHELMVSMVNGQEEDVIAVDIPVMEVNMWTLNQLSDALQNPETDPELLIYLEYALNELMSTLFGGEQVTSIAVVTPPGVIATAPEPAPIVITPEVVVPEPALPPLPPGPILVIDPTPVPVAPDVVAEPELVAEPESVAPVSSPLVQIIVNIAA